jgi:N-acetylglucosaminyldiphosphoundecaprenol N-acetyl-beta-D-mannosaminyltransferase
MAQKVKLFEVGLSVVDYSQACEELISAARENRSFTMTAFAIHGLMESVADPDLRRLVNEFDLVTPDGQPVRWAMNLLHNTKLRDRVCGPDLMKRVCKTAAKEGIGIYLFGSTLGTVEKLSSKLSEDFPGLKVCGLQPDRFREATPEEDLEDIRRINQSGAGIVLVGRGCPQQERWVAEHRGKVNAAMMAVGAAFDFVAGNLARAPRWMQRVGLEWLFRLLQEPRRLFWRYLVTNSLFLFRLGCELIKAKVLPKEASVKG